MARVRPVSTRGPEQVKVVEAGGSGSQRDSHRRHYGAGGVGDGVRRQADEMRIEDISDV